MLVFPVAAFFIILKILRRSLDWREALLATAVFFGACIVLITETLSVPRLIGRGPVAISWLAICLAGAFWLVFKRAEVRRPESSDLPPASLDRPAKVLLAGAGIIALLVGITALVSPPNMWDAMTYHLPRVILWMSNRSVRFFATPDYQQLLLGPWSEFATMHTYLLSGGDRLVNMVQFFSLLGSAIGVSVIAKLLGAGAWGQALAALVCITIPEGILEASGPMNGYVVAFWIATTVVFTMRWMGEPSALNTVCVGLSAGLALLTKGTAYLFLPMLVLACWWMGSRPAKIRFLKLGAVFVVLIAAMNGPQYLRCYHFTGSPLGLPVPGGTPRLDLNIHDITVRGTAANVLRNVSLQMGTPSAAVNSKIERAFRMAIHEMGANPDDPEATFLGEPFEAARFSLNEVRANNPLHLILWLVCAGVVFWKGPKGEGSRCFWLCGGIVLSFVFYCAALKWSIWYGRLHLPLFVIAAAPIGFVLERYFSKRWAIVTGIALLSVGSLFSAMNHSRSLIPWSRLDDVYHARSVLYFSDQHEAIAADYLAAAQAVHRSGCTQIAIDSYVKDLQIKHVPNSFFVYPLMALIHADGKSRIIWYTDVQNLSNRYAGEVSHPSPCAVLCLDCADVAQKWREYRRPGGDASVFHNIVLFQ